MKVEDWGDESSVTISFIREDGERLMPKRFLKILTEGAGSLFQYFTPSTPEVALTLKYFVGVPP